MKGGPFTMVTLEELFGSSNPVNKTNLTNVLSDSSPQTYEKGKAYVTTLEDNLCTIFTLGSFQNRFYETAEEAIKDIDNILRKALQECPELATKYAVYSAETLRMKLMPTLWLVYLSTLDDKTLLQKAFPRIIGNNVKLLHDFVDICRNTNIRPGGHMRQRIKGTNRGLGSGLKKLINKLILLLLYKI